MCLGLVCDHGKVALSQGYVGVGSLYAHIQRALKRRSYTYGDAPTLDDIRRYCDEQKVTKYMVPQHLVVLPEFPMTPTGKVRKASLQEDAARRAQAEQEGAAS